MIYDAHLNANIGAEMQVAPKWSVDLSGQVNFWTLSHKRKWKNWMVQPEARYWLCEAMTGHFFAGHLIGGEYNVGSLDLPDKFMGTNFKDLRDNHIYQVVVTGVLGETEVGLKIAYGVCPWDTRTVDIPPFE